MNGSIPGELTAFVDANIAFGRHASSGDIVREALQLQERVEQEKSLVPATLGTTASATARSLTSTH